LARFLELVLGVLAGNLGAPGTRAIVDDTGRRRFVPLSLPLSARVESVGALNSLRHLGPQQAEASLSDLIQRRPRAAQALCYRGELYLWQGRYDEAWRDFVAANRIEPLRWANIGLFAVLVMTGQFHRAQAFGVYADNRNTAISGGTLPVYRGVLRRRLGDMKGAVEALTPAVEAKPSRIGARMELALALRALGRSIEAQAHVDVVVQEGAAILISAADALGLSFLDEPAVLTSDGVFEEALASMRGNRSSLLVTWFDVHGGLRVLRSRLNWKGPARSVRSEWRRDGKAG
jgi:tetratricopeptide (TPR) repeat protein